MLYWKKLCVSLTWLKGRKCDVLILFLPFFLQMFEEKSDETAMSPELWWQWAGCLGAIMQEQHLLQRG